MTTTSPLVIGKIPGELKLTKNHQYWWTPPEGGKKVKFEGVTTVIKDMIAKDALVNWAANEAVDHMMRLINPGLAYSQEDLAKFFAEARAEHRDKTRRAADAGTMAHDWIEGHIYGTEEPLPENEEAKAACNQYIAWRQQHHVEYLEVEWKVGDTGRRVGGKIDSLARVDGKLRIVDLKTGKWIYIDNVIQACEYDSMARPLIAGEELHPPLLLHIPKDGREFQPVELPFDPRLGAAVFACLLEARRGIKDIKKAMSEAGYGEKGGKPDEEDAE